MKAAVIAIILFVALLAIKFVRGDGSFRVRDAFPFLAGEPFSIYDCFGLAMIVITVLALRRLMRPA